MNNRNTGALPSQVLAYVIVGLTNTLWAYAIFAGLIYVGVHYAVATLFSGVLSVLTGYVAQRRVFGCAGRSRLARFSALFIVIYGLNITIQTILMEPALALNRYVAGAVAVCVCATMSFIANRIYVFR